MLLGLQKGVLLPTEADKDVSMASGDRWTPRIVVESGTQISVHIPLLGQGALLGDTEERSDLVVCICDETERTAQPMAECYHRGQWS